MQLRVLGTGRGTGCGVFVERRLEDTQAGRHAAFSHVGFWGKEKLLFLEEAAVVEKRSWQQRRKGHWGRNQLKVPPDLHTLKKIPP